MAADGAATANGVVALMEAGQMADAGSQQ